MQLHPSIWGNGCMNPSIFRPDTTFRLFCPIFAANGQMLHPSIEISNKGTEQQCSVAVLWQSLSLLPRRAATPTAAPLYGATTTSSQKCTFASSSFCALLYSPANITAALCYTERRAAAPRLSSDSVAPPPRHLPMCCSRRVCCLWLV